MLNIRQAVDDGQRTVVAASGQVDLATAPDLAMALAQAIDAGTPELVVDLRRVDFLDSAGIGVLVEAARNATAGEVAMSVHGAHGWVARVLQITGVEDYLRVESHPPADPAG